jgi:hypothetical protein
MGKWNPFTKTSDDTVDKKDQSKSEADELVERLGASMEERLKPFRDEITSLKNDWESIKQAASKAEEPPPPDPASLTPEQRHENERNALLALTVQAHARITEADCISNVASRWPNLIPQIKDAFAKTPVQRKAQTDYAEYCQNIVKMLVGDAAMKAGLNYDDKREGSKFFIEDGAGKGDGDESLLSDRSLTWQDPINGRVETPRDTLRKLGIKPEEFEEAMKKGAV